MSKMNLLCLTQIFVIQDRTGYRSLNGLRKYERITEKQKEDACKTLSVKPTESEQKEDIIPVQVTEPNSSTLDRGMTCHSFSMQRFQVNLEQQQPSLSFGSSHIQGCTINIYQSLPVSKDE